MNPPPLPAAPQRSGLAVTSLILGIVGWVLCPLAPFFGIAAVIAGHKAARQIRASEGRLTGLGMVATSLALGYGSFLVLGLYITVATVLVQRHIHGNLTTREQVCMSQLKVIKLAKSIWAMEDGKGAEAIPSAQELFGPGKAIPDQPTCPSGGRYDFNALNEPPSCSLHGPLVERRPRHRGR